MTLTYVYGDQTAVLGPLATYAEPHAYDLCLEHSERLSAPRGWEVLRLATGPLHTAPSHDHLLAPAAPPPARPTTPCPRWPTPWGRPGGRCRPLRAPSPRTAPARPTARATSE